MNRLILAAVAATALAGPAIAAPGWDRHDDRRELQADRRELRGDLRRGDLGEYRRDHAEYRRDVRDFREDRRDWRDDRRDWRNDRRTDWRWSGDRYRERWHGYPRGFAYRPYGVGVALPRAYWGDRYWIARPDYFRLPPAWRGTRWVRVGPDALLIRLADGFVVRAVRSLYW